MAQNRITQTPPNAPFETLQAFFQEDGWPFEYLKDLSALRIPFQGANGEWVCFAQAREGQSQVVFYSIAAVNAPAEKRAAVAEFITRANYGLLTGNFEMDFEDGEIRCRTNLDIEGGRLNTGMVKQLAYTNVTLMDRYLPGLMRVLYSDVEPALAIIEVEEAG